MMLFIFAAKEQKDPVKPSSDEVTEACLVSPLNLAVPVIEGPLTCLRQVPVMGKIAVFIL